VASQTPLLVKVPIRGFILGSQIKHFQQQQPNAHRTLIFDKKILTWANFASGFPAGSLAIKGLPKGVGIKNKK
jgi:hypothetical protein